MSYPGTKVRERTALESSLITRVTELERERDELVEALREMASRSALNWKWTELDERVHELLAKYPK